MKVFLQKATALITILAVTTACGGRGDNKKLQEAKAIHTSFMQTYDSTYFALEEEQTRVIKLIAKTPETDERYSAYQSMKRSIDKSFGLLKSWQEAVVPVPGMEHDHDSHAPHDHDPAREATVKGMSDQEILDLQKAYKTRLDEVSTEINNLLETIQNYQTRAQ